MIEMQEGDLGRSNSLVTGISQYANRLGYVVHKMELIGDGAVVAVIANKRCIGPYVFMKGAPQYSSADTYRRTDCFFGWDASWDIPEIPGFLKYHQCGWDVKPDNFTTDDIKDMLDESRELIRKYNEQQWKSFFSKPELA